MLCVLAEVDAYNLWRLLSTSLKAKKNKPGLYGLASSFQWLYFGSILKYTNFLFKDRSEDISEIVPFLSVLYQRYEIKQKLLMGVNWR